MKIIYFKKFLFFKFNFSLGAIHDQTGTAISCPASNNNIMTSSVGAYTNSTNMFYFSNCSIISFKQTLLTSDYKYVVYNFSWKIFLIDETSEM